MRAFSLVLFAVVATGVLTGRAQDVPRRSAVRVDPVSTIIDAFATYPVVALGEGPHGNVQGHAFRLALFRDPRFTGVVNDIVVESGSSCYQDYIDRFVRGEDVADVVLRAARENTVTPTPAWDRPKYDELFRAVRDINKSVPRDRQLRILLGDPPINWSEVRNANDHRAWLLRRDSHPAELVQREVLGSAPYEAFFGPPPPVDVFKAHPNIEDHYDAVLVLGTAESLRLAPIEYPHCAEPDYVKMRVARMTLSGMPATVGERLAKECAAAAPLQ
jgi:hypothetical protein